jgi:hypothetical protein
LKNKILLMVLSLAFFCTNIYAKEKDPSKLMAGIILASAGAIVAYSGFQMAEISVPEITTQSFVTVTTGTGPWDITAQSTIKNTGNVDVENIIMTVIYKDSMGAEITSENVSLPDKLAVSGTYTYNSSALGLAAEPLFFSTRFWANYDKTYTTSSPSAAAVGCTIIAAGAFLICDYIFDITDFMEKTDVKVQLSAVNNGLNLMTSKSF